MARKRKQSKKHYRIVYRDYRPGHRGEFTSKAVYNRSQGQGVTCHIHRELAAKPERISHARDLFEYEDYDPEWPEEEYHGTGDTGKKK